MDRHIVLGTHVLTERLSVNFSFYVNMELCCVKGFLNIKALENSFGHRYLENN